MNVDINVHHCAAYCIGQAAKDDGYFPYLDLQSVQVSLIHCNPS
jgi:hypothetical protein